CVSHTLRLRGFQTMAADAPESDPANNHASAVFRLVLRSLGYVWSGVATPAHPDLRSAGFSNSYAVRSSPILAAIRCRMVELDLRYVAVWRSSLSLRRRYRTCDALFPRGTP